ncbi:MAG TPA: PQQ-binding-like beta-propeller repeat protein, partial [Polyangiaceae bacterium]|nr:PQQ-binding-like beta-propeller repeat protein [Polyangiaceae bacterium]
SPVVSPAPRPAAPELDVVGGDLVDLGAMAPVHALTSDLVFSDAVSTDTAYLWVRGELRAYDTARGSLRWNKPSDDCWSMVASRSGVFCSSEHGARWYRSADGDAKPAGAATAVSAIVALGGRVLVVHSDKKLEALDDRGAVVGTTLAPVIPDSGYRRTALEIGGTLACGAQRSDAATTVFCTDATPRIVWSRRLPVAGGLLRQVDADVMVVTSDSWTNAASSEVLRTSDGATLLHSSSRLAAALATGGVFDGALSSEPTVTLFDAKGTPRWSWTGALPHAEALRAVRSGPNIVLARYNPIATGAQLVALDEATGTPAWQGDVDSLMIGHSKYSNAVELQARGNVVLLRGHESGQDYAQTFDPATGKRLASILRRR